MFAWPALAAASAVAAYFCWELPRNDVRLRVENASSNQLRITWNRESAPVLLAHAAAIEIQDGGTYREALLTPDQLRAGSLVYLRESGTVEVRLRLESRWPGSALAWFQGAEPPRAPSKEIRATLPSSVPELPVSAAVEKPRSSPEPPRPQDNADRTVPPPRRAAVIPESVPARIESASLLIPAPPVEPIAKPIAMGSLPIAAPAPKPPGYSGPRSGRIIWTGSMGHRGVVEIEGSHASIGSISGGLPGMPVTLRISPAEFSSRGLTVHSGDPSINNRREAASAANGWNATFFQWEPDRARELVVLEAPDPSNEFKRLVVRNDARTCSVIVVDWTVR
jgi:hypothetical protein